MNHPGDCYMKKIPDVGIWINSKVKTKLEKEKISSKRDPNIINQYDYITGFQLIKNQRTFVFKGSCGGIYFETGKYCNSVLNT